MISVHTFFLSRDGNKKKYNGCKQFLGHILRGESSSYVRVTLTWKPEGRTKGGRPKEISGGEQFHKFINYKP